MRFFNNKVESLLYCATLREKPCIKRCEYAKFMEKIYRQWELLKARYFHMNWEMLITHNFRTDPTSQLILI
ncbi:hypothetical protein NECAME_04610 [Necator americanus]|uniref:Uncharacterized protein n=1 Tax=Necator americanus TaxID=51031 RepID=W2SPX4_NECAM|nr:hypothetical protein NECAME_04610 [Necator americanus]ETN71578.1 hypothetical protein NECAME_04610 [Necator americanus]